ncbi:hypothetical protein MMC29_006665, partial [Sticta canariensis]|nr:hypothetical protein [Sticta canariensis]
MARSNLTAAAAAAGSHTKQPSQLSLLESINQEPEISEEQPNPLAILNQLLALQNLEDIFEWLGTDQNPTKLLKFIVAVRDDYNELATDYNELEADRNKKLKQKDRVILHLMDQIAGVTAENDTLRSIVDPPIVDSPIVDLPIVNPPIVNPPIVDLPIVDPLHEPSPGPSNGTVSSSTKKRHAKLQDPLVFTNGKHNMPVEHLLVKMRRKMSANSDLYDTLELHMVYVMNRVEGMAFSHLEPRSQDNATNP